MIDLGRSRPFQRLIIAIYWVAIPVLVLGAASVSQLDRLPGRWSIATGLCLGAMLLCWRLWLYRRALGVGGAAPPLRRLLLVWAPLAVLAFAGFAVVLVGFMVFAIPFLVMSEPKFGVATYGWSNWCVIAVFALVVVAFGAGLMSPLVLMLRKCRPSAIEPEAPPADDDQASQDASPA